MSGDLSWRWKVWGWFMWLPARPYYWLGDRLVGLGGWRPLDMRYPEHFKEQS
jgi:hypothetical protein